MKLLNKIICFGMREKTIKEGGFLIIIYGWGGIVYVTTLLLYIFYD